MKSIQSKVILLILSLLTISNALAFENSKKINFWDTQKKGTNIMSHNVTVEDIKAAKNYGIKFIRLVPDKFSSSHRDFLIGDADEYNGLIPEDLDALKEILAICQKEDMPVVISMLSLPGSRWKQNNNFQDDLKIWQQEKYKQQAALFWQDLSFALKDHPIIIGYNILNEPHPERIFEPLNLTINTVNQDEVQIMLHDFYAKVIKHIRLSDEHTPIILDSSSYGDSMTFKELKPHSDKNIIYSFHIYEPYIYTNLKTNNGQFCYPGIINGKNWDMDTLRDYMSAVNHFQKSNHIPSNRIFAGEFGGHRMTCGLDEYFKDLISIFNDNNWHYAFYAFREDIWDGMDYELGDKKLPWNYWQSIEKGEIPQLKRDYNHSAFLVVKNDLQK